ncbi:MAG: glycosyltransferase family 4 protein [Niameybacter sp.]|nr:glycosyltransferase family 4 protein [Niameybacter sp.]
MVGGIQTYIRQLTELIKKRGDTPIIVQFADDNFEKNYNDICVYGVDVKGITKEHKKSKLVLDFIKKSFKKEDILIFATEDIFIPSFTNNVIVIQHGITWDLPVERGEILKIKGLKKFLWGYVHLFNTRKIKKLVCVDHNYVNWVRAQGIPISKTLYPIPNCTYIDNDIYIRNDEEVRIIFARRFEKYRGTRLFAASIERVLRKYPNVYVTFAGRGPDEEYLKRLFESNDRVEFITYQSDKSLEIHKKYDIAVVPTLGSEGTSLSLLEAMACKCAVIATNIGGITNIILDRYNGLLIMPDEKLLTEALEKLIIDKELRKTIGENAYLTASKAFNKEVWEEKWEKVLEDIDNEI